MNTRRAYLLACLLTTSFGLNASLIGPSLQTFADHTRTPLDLLGVVFTAMSLGYLASAPLIAALGKRLDGRVLLTLPVALMVGSMLALAGAGSYGLLLAATFALGLGQSAAQVGYTTLVGGLYARDQVSAKLNRMSAFYGLGALLGPLLAAAGYRWQGESTPAFWLASALSTALLLAGARIALPAPIMQAAAEDAEAMPVSIWRTPVIWLMVGAMALYVGAEIAFGGWVTEYTRQSTGVDIALAALTASMFSAGVALSRFFANLLLKTRGQESLLSLSIAVMAAGVGLMLLPGGSWWLALAGALLVGLGAGPAFPTLLAIGIGRNPGSARLMTSMLTSAGSIGAITIPVLVGVLLNGPGGPALAWSVLLGAIGVYALFWISARRRL